MDNKTPLHSALSKRLENRRIQSTLRQLTRTPHVSVDFSSNDFLSLSSSSLLRTAYLAELQRQSPACPLSGASSFPLGSGGSRLLDGNSAYAEQLEKQIARFHNAPAALLCNSGFDANAGLFACLPQPGDVILHDELIHASVHDGMRLSRASRRVAFAHNSVEDLEQVLESLTEEDDELRDGRRNVFVAVEAIYSMDGDLAPLTEIVEVVERLLPRKNGHIIVDEAHSTGVLGPKGRGLVSELGLEKRIFVRLHTFGKALACNGAVILCAPLVRLYLINYARTLIYTTFMSFPCLAAISASYSLLQSGDTVPLVHHLQNLMTELYDLLQVLRAKYEGYPRVDELFQVPTACPRSPIFSVLSLHPRSLAKYCQDAGYMVRAVVPPTVPENAQRIRVCLHAGNTSAQVQGIVGKIEKWVENRLREGTQAATVALQEKARL